MSKLKAPIKIKELRAIADEKDLQAIVVVTVERNGNVSVVTYGENKQKCKAIGEWGQGLWNYAIALIPFQTVFGWGNKGVPQSITDYQSKRRLDPDTRPGDGAYGAIL